MFGVARALVLASFLFASIAAAWASHTDDGCIVELHCFACQWALASTADISLPVAPLSAFELTGRVVAAELPRLVEAPTPELASRGPPSV